MSEDRIEAQRFGVFWGTKGGRPARAVGCESCGKVVYPTEVMVYADGTGREGPAGDAYHLRCFLATCDTGLASNECLPMNINVYGQTAVRNYKRRHPDG
jgi:hypothetical protein